MSRLSTASGIWTQLMLLPRRLPAQRRPQPLQACGTLAPAQSRGLGVPHLPSDPAAGTSQDPSLSLGLSCTRGLTHPSLLQTTLGITGQSVPRAGDPPAAPHSLGAGRGPTPAPHTPAETLQPGSVLRLQPNLKNIAKFSVSVSFSAPPRQEPGLDSTYALPSARCPAPSAWCSVLGAQCPAPSARRPVHSVSQWLAQCRCGRKG